MLRNPARVLIVDDDDDIRDLVQHVLSNAGFRVEEACSGIQAIERCSRGDLELVLLDIMMPGMDGFETCRGIRDVSDVPVIFLSVKSSEQDIVDGFASGGQDYLVKPIRPRELAARLQAFVRRQYAPPVTTPHTYIYGNLVLDNRTRQVFTNGNPVIVSPISYELLKYFLKRVGQPVAKQDLLRDVWGYQDACGDYNLVEAAITRLRKDLHDDPHHPLYIYTIWGTGYRFGQKN